MRAFTVAGSQGRIYHLRSGMQEFLHKCQKSRVKRCINSRNGVLSTSNDAGSHARNGVKAVWDWDDGWSRKQWVLGVTPAWIRSPLFPECFVDACCWGIERRIRFIPLMNSGFSAFRGQEWGVPPWCQGGFLSFICPTPLSREAPCSGVKVSHHAADDLVAHGVAALSLADSLIMVVFLGFRLLLIVLGRPGVLRDSGWRSRCDSCCCPPRVREMKPDEVGRSPG